MLNFVYFSIFFEDKGIVKEMKGAELHLRERFAGAARVMAGTGQWALSGLQRLAESAKRRAQRTARRMNGQMSLKHVFYGAVLLAGAQMGPGLYYMTQETDIVRARVEGKVRADADTPYAGRKYMIHTDQGKFDTFGISGGGSLKEDCIYDFNLKGARLQAWPPSYSRSIKAVTPVSCK